MTSMRFDLAPESHLRCVVDAEDTLTDDERAAAVRALILRLRDVDPSLLVVPMDEHIALQRRAALEPPTVPLAQTWDHPGEYECYPPGTVAALTAQRDRLLAYVRAERRHYLAPTRYTAQRLTEARQTLIDTGDITEGDEDTAVGAQNAPGRTKGA